MRKILKGVCLIFALLLVLVPVAYAVEFLIDGYDASNRNGTGVFKAVHPSTDGYVSARGQTFNVSTAYPYLTRMGFQLWKNGNPVGHMKAALYATTGTYGSTSIPTGDPIEVSTDSLSMESLSGSLLVYYFTFSGTTELINGTVYAAVVYVSDATVFDSGTNYTDTGQDSTQTHSGNLFTYTGTAGWAGVSTIDNIFYVYGSDVEIEGGGGESEEVTSMNNMFLVVGLLAMSFAFMLFVWVKKN